MANPQLENGHTMVANEIIEAITRTNLSPYESRVLWAIVRKTYGYHKKVDRVAQSQIAEITGLPQSHVSRAMKSLVARLIVTSTGNKRIGINKDYEQWLPAQVTQKPKEKVTSKGQKVTSKGIKKLPAKAPQKIKDNDKRNIELPEWLDLEKWEAYLEMRRKIKKPMTDYAKKLAIKRLATFREQGQPVDVILDKSIMSNWQGLFALKPEELAVEAPPPPPKKNAVIV